MTKQVEFPEPAFPNHLVCGPAGQASSYRTDLYTADQMRQFREEGQVGMRKLKSHEEFWVDNRQKIIDCLEKAGYTLMSNQNGFFLYPKIGIGIAQSQAKGE